MAMMTLVAPAMEWCSDAEPPRGENWTCIGFPDH
jgi:hypothetical protein